MTTVSFPVLRAPDPAPLTRPLAEARGRLVEHFGRAELGLGLRPGSTRRFVLAALRLAGFDRFALGCGAAELVLHRCLDTLLGRAGASALPVDERWSAAEGAVWCAEELGVVYDEHGLAEHAEAVRHAARLAVHQSRTRFEA